jgi:hypothetical protein
MSREPLGVPAWLCAVDTTNQRTNPAKQLDKPVGTPPTRGM